MLIILDIPKILCDPSWEVGDPSLSSVTSLFNPRSLDYSMTVVRNLVAFSLISHYGPMGCWDHLPPNWDWGMGITAPWGIGITYLPTGIGVLGSPSSEGGAHSTPWGIGITYLPTGIGVGDPNTPIPVRV